MVSANRCSLVLPAVAMAMAMAVSSGTMKAQDSSGASRSVYVDDWTHHHVFFSSPGAQEDARGKSKLEDWKKVSADPRNQLQRAKRTFGTRPVADQDPGFRFGGSWDRNRDRRGDGGEQRVSGAGVKKDWNTPLGSGKGSSLIAVIATLNGTSISGSSTLNIDGVVFDASPPVAASQTGTFTGVPTAGRTATITNGATNTLVLTGVTSTGGTGTATFRGDPAGGDRFVVGGITYTWHGNDTGCNGVNNCIVHGGTTTQDAENLEAAINDNATQCGFTSGGSCLYNFTGANPSATATEAGAVTTITNTTAAAITFTTTSSGAVLTLNPATGTIPAGSGRNGCTSATSGTFIVGASATASATNLAAAITACHTTYAAVGVTGSAAGAIVTVSDATPGTGGNTGITLSATLNNFTWNGANLAGGTDGATSGTSTPPTFAYWTGTTYVANTVLATNIANAVNANATVSAVLTATANSPANGDVLFAAKAGGGYSVTPGSFTAFTGGPLAGGTTATVQPNTFPAMYGPSLTTASCANDFVVYPTGQVGAASGANIVAYNNLYTTGCTGTVPSAYWGYNTGTGYAVTTSPVLSPDGTEVAFVQSNGTVADLVVLRWKATDGSLGAPTTPALLTNITTCPVNTACMTVTPLSHNDTFSAPYYDYSADDALYVGDDNGSLEKLTAVFYGAIAGPTAVNLGFTYPLTSPVYDSVSGCVFVGDTEGYLYSASSGVAGSVCTSTAFGQFGHSARLGNGAADDGIFDAPIVDSTAGTVYAFVTSGAAVTRNVTATLSGTTSEFTVSSGSLTVADVGRAVSGNGITGTTTIAAVLTGTRGVLSTTPFGCLFGGCTNETLTITSVGAGDNAVDQFTTSTIGSGSTTAAPVQEEGIGTGGAGYNLYAGTFDNVYFSSPAGSSPSGSLYVLGNTGAAGGGTLYQIPIETGSIAGVNQAVTGLNSTEHPWPSPLLEFCNNGTNACAVTAGGTCGAGVTCTTSGTDYLFFSVNRGTASGCTNAAGNGCILSYNINTTAPRISGAGLNVTTPGTNGCWATGGMVIDNSASGTTGAQQIYFVDLNGAAAGGVNATGGESPTSADCTAGASPIIYAVQTAQSNP